MTDPATREDYDKAAIANTVIEGTGAEVRTILPCPFCAAPGWLTFPITAALNEYDDVTQSTTCGVCGRTGRLKFTRIKGQAQMEIVQTGGDDPPDYLKPWPRREP